MTSYLRLLISPLVIVFFANAVAVAQQNTANSHSLEDEAEWVKIRQIKVVYDEVARTGKVEKLAPYLSRDFSAAMVTGTEVKGLEGFESYDREMRKRIGEGGSYQLETTYEPGIIINDVAVAHGKTNEEVVTSDGDRFRFHSLWSAVLRKEDGAWKLFRVHVSMDPIDNVFVQTFRQRAQVMSGGLALLAGLLVGWLLRGMIFRRRAAVS